MKFITIASLLSVVGLASATNYTVTVGGNGTLTYSPTSISGVNVGDTIAFQFVAKNHTVTQSTFNAPCTSSGIDSGFFPVAANATQIPQWSFTVDNASAPLWFYCKQTGHCGMGMVFAVNPTAAKSFDAFQQAAMATASNTSSTSGTSTSPSVSAGSGSGSSTDAAGASTTSSAAMSNAVVRGTTGLLAVLGLVAGVAL